MFGIVIFLELSVYFFMKGEEELLKDDVKQARHGKNRVIVIFPNKELENSGHNRDEKEYTMNDMHNPRHMNNINTNRSNIQLLELKKEELTHYT